MLDHFQGMNTIFHISLALLHDAAADLLQLDFEGALKYVPVTELVCQFRMDPHLRLCSQIKILSNQVSGTSESHFLENIGRRPMRKH